MTMVISVINPSSEDGEDDGDVARPPHGIILRHQRRILGRRAVRSERSLEVRVVLTVVPKLVPVLVPIFVPIFPFRTRPDTPPPVTTTPTPDRRGVSGNIDGAVVAIVIIVVVVIIIVVVGGIDSSSDSFSRIINTSP